jgi:tetratricopeptide (TPR) repeat protein
MPLAFSDRAPNLDVMSALRKLSIALAVAAGLGTVLGLPAAGQVLGTEVRIEKLMADLAEPDANNPRAIEAEIVRAWSQSGSDAMDLLLRRGRDAIEDGDHGAAVEHLTALTDHAPDFAEGWHARATAFYYMGEYSLALADIERVLSLNPRHFIALSGLAAMLDSLGETQLALEAYRAARALNPHRDELVVSIERLERALGGAEL